MAKETRHEISTKTCMDSLFPDEPVFPTGFSYLPEFITAAEEQRLCGIMSTLPLSSFMFHGFEAKRKVASYGYDYHFDSRSITQGNPIPEAFNFLIGRVAEHLKIPAADFKEVLATEYPAGSVINWHRDAPPFALIAGISLASDCTFRLRPYDKAKQSRASTLSFPVLRRSLYVMQGPAREAWEHSITPVRKLRYSVTLRTLR
jgi:alkylated DNA repair dioxygenase AlkB